jgi:ankyrin repeat protein
VVEILELLIDRGFNADYRAEGENTVLMNACYQEDFTVVRFLIERGADPLLRSWEEETSFFMAASSGNLRLVELMLRSLDETDRLQDALNEIMFGGAQTSDGKMVQFALQQGADIGAKCPYGHTALMHAGISGNSDAVRLLLSEGVDLNSKADDGSTPLNLAARSGDLETLKLIIEAGGDPNDYAGSHVSALHEASTSGNPQSVELLLQAGIDVDLRNAEGRTPLMCACIAGKSAIAELLLDSGANVNASNDHGMTPLMFAAIHVRSEVLELLINRGANVNAKDHSGSTALMNACASDFGWLYEKCWTTETHTVHHQHHLLINTVNKLIDAGAEVACLDSHGFNALRNAWANRYWDVSALLIERTPKLDPNGSLARALLEEACALGYSPIIDALRKKGATILNESERIKKESE